MIANAACRLAEGVAMRRENFGGLIYRYDNRRLYFIHSPQMVEFLAGLDGTRPLQDAAAAFLTHHPDAAPSSDVLLRTVEQLKNMGLVEVVALD